MKLRETTSMLAVGALGLHLTGTFLNNTPDAYNLSLARFVGGWTLPGWRFFAPNPGVQNVHLLARVRSADSEHSATPWRDVTPRKSHHPVNMVWNPGSRAPKALFDCMQQLSVLTGNSADFGFIAQSTPYVMIRDFTRGRLQSAPLDRDGEYFQFMVLNAFPSRQGPERMKPIVVSDWNRIRV